MADPVVTASRCHGGSRGDGVMVEAVVQGWEGVVTEAVVKASRAGAARCGDFDFFKSTSLTCFKLLHASDVLHVRDQYSEVGGDENDDCEKNWHDCDLTLRAAFCISLIYNSRLFACRCKRLFYFFLDLFSQALILF